MNQFELTCQYCGHSWEINYIPQEMVYCQICGDSNVRAKNIAAEKVDYYIGSPPFEKVDDKWNS